MIPQDASAALDPMRSVAGFLAGVAVDHGRSDDDVRRAVEEAGVPEHGIVGASSRLSGGEARRVLLAALILSDPDVWVLDEPTSGLDDAGVARVLAVVDRARAAGRVVLIATHDGAFAARSGCERFFVRDGVVDRGTPPEPSRSAAAEAVSGARVLAWGDLVVPLGATRRLAVDDGALAAGSVTGLVGPSGAGKSSFCAALSGDLPVVAGHVTVDDTPFVSVGSAPSGPGRRRVGWVRQDAFTALDPRRTVAFLLAEAATSAAAVTAAVEIAGVPSASFDRRPSALSGGERARVQLARVLASEPRALLLDEAFAGIDPERRAAILRALRTWAVDGGRAVLIVTHDHTWLDAAGIPRFVVAGVRILPAAPAC